MNIGKTIADFASYRESHFESIIRSERTRTFLNLLSGFSAIMTIMLLSVHAPIAAIPFVFFAIPCMVLFPIFIKYTAVAWKMFNEDNRTLFKELRKNGISFSRTLDLFSCSNATSLNSEVLKIIAESKLDLIKMQSLIETKEQVDAINHTDPNSLEVLKVILNSDKIKVKLLNNPEKLNTIRSINCDRLQIMLNGNYCYFFDIEKLFNKQVIENIKLIDVEKLKIVVNSTGFHNYGMEDLFNHSEMMHTLDSIGTEQLRVIFNNGKINSFDDLTNLLKDNKVLIEIKSTQAEKLKAVFDSDKFKLPEIINLLSDLKKMNRLGLIDSEKLEIIFCNSKFYHKIIINLLEEQKCLDGIKAINSEVLKFIVNIKHFRKHWIIALFSDPEKIEMLNSINAETLKRIVNGNLFFEGCVLNSTLQELKNISNNVEKNPALADRIFNYEFSYLETIKLSLLYRNENFDAEKIERNFRFALALYGTDQIDNITIDYLTNDAKVLEDLKKYLNKLPGNNYSLEDLKQLTETDLLKMLPIDNQDTSSSLEVQSIQRFSSIFMNYSL